MRQKNSVLLLLALLITGVLFIGISGTNNNSSEESAASDGYYNIETGLPLIYHMSFISRYAAKLYFAGEAENWELADIYNHEIEEISENIIALGEVHDGANISQLMESMLLPQVEILEEAIDSGDREMFLDRYSVMIQTCNQCHEAADYGAVNVTVPEINPFSQDFSADE